MSWVVWFLDSVSRDATVASESHSGVSFGVETWKGKFTVNVR